MSLDWTTPEWSDVADNGTLPQFADVLQEVDTVAGLEIFRCASGYTIEDDEYAGVQPEDCRTGPSTGEAADALIGGQQQTQLPRPNEAHFRDILTGQVVNPIITELNAYFRIRGNNQDDPILQARFAANIRGIINDQLGTIADADVPHCLQLIATILTEAYREPQTNNGTYRVEATATGLRFVRTGDGAVLPVNLIMPRTEGNANTPVPAANGQAPNADVIQLVTHAADSLTMAPMVFQSSSVQEFWRVNRDLHDRLRACALREPIDQRLIVHLNNALIGRYQFGELVRTDRGFDLPVSQWIDNRWQLIGTMVSRGADTVFQPSLAYTTILSSNSLTTEEQARLLLTIHHMQGGHATEGQRNNIISWFALATPTQQVGNEIAANLNRALHRVGIWVTFHQETPGDGRPSFILRSYNNQAFTAQELFAPNGRPAETDFTAPPGEPIFLDYRPMATPQGQMDWRMWTLGVGLGLLTYGLARALADRAGRSSMVRPIYEGVTSIFERTRSLAGNVVTRVYNGIWPPSPAGTERVGGNFALMNPQQLEQERLRLNGEIARFQALPEEIRTGLYSNSVQEDFAAAFREGSAGIFGPQVSTADRATNLQAMVHGFFSRPGAPAIGGFDANRVVVEAVNDGTFPGLGRQIYRYGEQQVELVGRQGNHHLRIRLGNGQTMVVESSQITMVIQINQSRLNYACPLTDSGLGQDMAYRRLQATEIGATIYRFLAQTDATLNPRAMNGTAPLNPAVISEVVAERVHMGMNGGRLAPRETLPPIRLTHLQAVNLPGILQPNVHIESEVVDGAVRYYRVVGGERERIINEAERQVHQENMRVHLEAYARSIAELVRELARTDLSDQLRADYESMLRQVRADREVFIHNPIRQAELMTRLPHHTAQLPAGSSLHTIAGRARSLTSTALVMMILALTMREMLHHGGGNGVIPDP